MELLCPLVERFASFEGHVAEKLIEQIDSNKPKSMESVSKIYLVLRRREA